MRIRQVRQSRDGCYRRATSKARDNVSRGREAAAATHTSSSRGSGALSR